MSDFFENQTNKSEQPLTNDTVSEKVVQNVDTEDSTIFSAPVEHEKKSSKSQNKKMLTSLICTAVAVAVLIGGTFAVIKLIPELTEEEVASSIFEDITVLDKDSSTFTAVNVTNTNGTFKFITKEITTTDEDGQTTTSSYWGIENVDFSKMSTDSVNNVISAAASITALREITTKTTSECGFDNPLISVSVEDATNGSFAFKVGDQSTDGLGYYFMVDGSEKIYVVPTSVLSSLQFQLVDLADKTAIPATTFTVDTADNKAEDGSFAYFDSLTLSGTLYSNTVTIENNKENNASAEIVPYIITKPSNRYGNTENISSLLALFSNTISIDGNYALDISDQTLKEFGLDNPDAVVTLTIKGESKTFKFSIVDSEYCAVIYDGATMIRKASISSFTFLSLKTESYYNSQPFMYSINDVSKLTLTDSEGKVEFDISYTEDEESNKTYHILTNGTELVASEFQTFYGDLVGTQCTDFSIDETTDEPLSTITFTFNNGSVTNIDFYKISETKYQYSINDTPMGKLTSSAYKKIIKNLKAQAETE